MLKPLKTPQPKPEVITSTPTVEDVTEIHALISSYSVNATKRLLLPRSQGSIVKDLQSFVIIKHENEIVGCVALKIWNETSAEVRSLAVKSDRHGLGLGKILMKELELRARALRIRSVFALTVAPEFFTSLGFHVVPKLRFPDKIAGDCMNCEFLENCVEVTVSKTLHFRKLQRV